MKKIDPAMELINEIHKTISVLEKIDNFYRNFLENEMELLGKRNSSAIILAEIFTDFYTCLETLFMRISQFFGNNLRKDSWHKDLLYKMTFEIENIRIPVISDSTYQTLYEFLKFRHFKRYCFEFEYDWDKLEFLEKKYKQTLPQIKNELKSFEIFLKKISE